MRKEEIKPSKLPVQSLLKVKDLLTTREKMVKHRGAYQSHLKALGTFYKQERNSVIFESQEKMIQELNKQIKLIEEEMDKLLNLNEEEAVKKNYQLVTSVKGVGLILGATLLVYTNNFSRFKTWREFASYAGIAPFEHSSGIIKSGKRINNLFMPKYLHKS